MTKKYYEVYEKESNTPVDLFILDKGETLRELKASLDLGETYEIRKVLKGFELEAASFWFEFYKYEDLDDKEYAGSVAVDSGQLMITDPCYVIGKGTEEEYKKTCEVTLTPDNCGQILNGSAFALGTAYGDGIYDVFVKRDSEGRITKVEIDLE
ncbi:hypothetical protein CEF21_15055 [Bacillus sp. FJAT-42376]|uniref:hypothetical protein n=1 Tax=Bacillus sp. FJAT-42376 TaxID=2014076 RepID=UPI000F513F7C|nr:hypothetical protein [Bacillus sp. FJAT-42376]AZB43514.1 hypothetical protein CEF21_15055 [Bacillus sp. FJAT-42376]